MNTAKLTARVGWFGKHWTVKIGDQPTQTAKNIRQLIQLLTGQAVAQSAPEQFTVPTTETVEQYLARGGKITKVSFPTNVPPLPQATPEPKIVAPSRITLADLGLIYRPKAPAPEAVVCGGQTVAPESGQAPSTPTI